MVSGSSGPGGSRMVGPILSIGGAPILDPARRVAAWVLFRTVPREGNPAGVSIIQGR
nr:hypothetical protein GCM10010200_026730 [Actinomadura rugatobispora]